MKPAFDIPYTDLRKKSYPSLAEFADAFYWSQRGNPDKMAAYLAKIDAVKTQIPKLKEI